MQLFLREEAVIRLYIFFMEWEEIIQHGLRNPEWQIMFGMDSFNPMRLLASNMLSDKQLAAYILEPIIITVISGIIFFVKGADNEAL